MRACVTARLKLGRSADDVLQNDQLLLAGVDTAALLRCLVGDMVRRAAVAGDERVYDISGQTGAALDTKLSIGARATAAAKRARRKADLEQRETELLQEFEFPTVCQKVKLSDDERFIFASGTYPPQVHVYDTDQLSMKFKRHVDNEIVDFQILENDWKKFALLTADRYIDLHSPFGSHFRSRVPKCGRDLMLDKSTCDLFVCGAGPDVWRLNLEQGRFMAPILTRSGAYGGNNACAVNPVNRLLAFGGDTGLVEVWDPRVVGRATRPAGKLNIDEVLQKYVRSVGNETSQTEITALRFDETDGYTMAVGTNVGYTLLFDLRSPKPTLCRDQGYGLPIQSLRLHRDGKHCISADPKSVKVWNRSDGVNRVAIEPDADINHLCVIGKSGVMCAALEAPRVKSYYVPSLGTAPRWCAFLDTFTEELEDNTRRRSVVDSGAGAGVEQEEVYENYKFVSSEELEGLGLGHLIGTEMLKPYMHGFFVHAHLYRRALDASAPFAYEKYRQERAREKLEAERESRIGKVRTKRRTEKIKVNKKTAELLESRRRQGRKGAAGASIVDDPRFKAMFENKDFAVDERAERFVQLNPLGIAESRRAKEASDDSDEEYLEQFTLVDEDGGAKPDGRAPEPLLSGSSSGDSSSDEEDEDSAALASDAGIRKSKQVWKEDGRKAARMFEIADAGEVLGHQLFSKGTSRKTLSASRDVRDKVPLGKRVQRTRATRASKRGR